MTLPALNDLFAEPPVRSAQWLRLTYSRVLLAAEGMVAQPGGDADLVRRLAVAGVPTLAPHGDEEAARRETYPAIDALAQIGWGVGSPAPTLVVVGAVDPRALPWPLYSRSGVWLMRALRELGHDELRVYLCNAYDGPEAKTQALEGIYAATAAHAPVFVALGQEAAGVLRAADVEHVPVQHPAWARRFRFKDGPEGFAQILNDAGVPAGTWRSRQLPNAPSLPTRPAPDTVPDWVTRFRLPNSVAYRKQTRKRTTSGRGHIRRSMLEKARRFFVTGAVETVKDAALQAGIPEDRYAEVLAHYRTDDWEAERTAQVDRTRDEFYRQAADAEAKALAASRRVSSSLLLDALSRLQEKIRSDPTYLVGATGIRALAETSRVLDDVASAGRSADERLAQLREMAPVQQAKELVRTLRDTFGEDVVPKDGGS